MTSATHFETVKYAAGEEVDEALFSSSGYPHLGDTPVLNRKQLFRAVMKDYSQIMENRNKRVRVSITEHPYVVSIRRLHAHYLTGALITSNIIITVAHPLYNVPTTELAVVTGENYSDRGSTYLTVLLVVIHQNFNPYTLVADLAMIRVYEDLLVKANQKVIPIFGRRPSPGKTKWEYKAYVSGWGRCDWTHDVPLREGMLCAGTARQEQELAPCLAAPGAPLVVLGLLVGLQSWGLGCGFNHDLPLIYTDLQYYRNWIVKNTQVMEILDMAKIYDLYVATKANIMRDWLVQAREERPDECGYSGHPLVMTAIDEMVVQSEGTITDFRDYINNGSHRQAKFEMYERARKRMVQARMIKKIHDSIVKAREKKPFINKTMINDELGLVFNENNSI